MTHRRMLDLRKPISVEFAQSDVKSPIDLSPPECSIQHIEYMLEIFKNYCAQGGQREINDQKQFISYEQLISEHTEWLLTLNIFTTKIAHLKHNSEISAEKAKEIQERISRRSKSISKALFQIQLDKESLDTINTMLMRCEKNIEEKKNTSLFVSRIISYPQQISEMYPSLDCQHTLARITAIQRKLQRIRIAERALLQEQNVPAGVVEPPEILSEQEKLLQAQKLTK